MAIKVGGSDSNLLAEINITPFTDVLLVLLIIFMVAATAVMQYGFNINLPKAVTSATEPFDRDIVVSINKENQIHIGNNPDQVDRDNVLSSLKRLKTDKNTDRVVIMAEGVVKYANVIWVMDVAKAAGLGSIALATPEGPHGVNHPSTKH